MSEQRVSSSIKMSTKIEDLPSEVQSNISELEGEIMQREQNYNYVDPNQSNIKVDIKKKVRFTGVDSEEETFWNKLRSEINEENALLLLVLLLSSSSSVDNYVSNIPYLGGYYSNGNSSVFKALFLLVVFILLKVFLLPKLSI
jgi:hypothetical protein